jgi:broad specificity phosphatase PhoE
METEPIQSSYLLFRHGKTDHNLGPETKHTFAGSKIDLPLNDEGIKNAKHIAEFLINRSDIDTIVSSNLKRSRQTAEIIVDELKNHQVNLNHIKLEDLHEIDIGDFAGHTEEEVKELYPEAARNFYNGEIAKWNFPNGESYAQIKERVESVIKQLSRINHRKSTIAIIGHGMINRVIMHELKMPEDYWKARSYPHDKIIALSIPKEKHE